MRKWDDRLPEILADRLSESGLCIFLFHGIIEHVSHAVRNYTGKHMDIDLFARSMVHLANVGHPMSMDEVLLTCERGAPFPRRAFAITFDDGFENNVTTAAPVLDDLGIPAMIYVTSGFVEANRMSWIDRIELAVEEAPATELKLPWAPEPIRIGDAASRIALLERVRQRVKSDSGCDPNAFADDLCARLGMPDVVSTGDPLDQKMSWRQVREAHESALLSIGGHGHTHSILSFLSPAELDRELDTSLDLLRERAGVETTHYSYPEGLAHCYSDDVITGLKERGIRCSPTAIDGLNAPGSDPFHLRRILVA